MKKLLEKVIPKAIGALLNVQSIFNKRAAAIHAFDIFCTPRRGRLSSTQKEYLKPYKDKELSLEGNTLQTYLWEGAGPTVLLIHGWESNAHRWWKLIPELQARNYRIVTFDAPAHGASGGDRFSAILYAKAIYEVVTHYKPDYQVAHSVGALSSLLYFRDKKPKDLKKLAILGAPSELEEIMQDYQNILGLRQAIMNELNLLLQEQYPFSFKTFSGAAFAKAVSIPGLIIHDKLDPVTPVTASQAIHKNWKNSIYIETEGYGHSLHQEDVRKAVLDFLDN